MKRFLALIATGVLLAACHDKVRGPEYTTGAQFGPIVYTPMPPVSTANVSVSVPITSLYGLQQAFLVYWLDGRMDAAVQTQPVPYLETSKEVTFTAMIPKQSVQTKVGFQVVAITPYGVWSVSETVTYIVDAPSAKPTDPDDPDAPADSGSEEESNE